MFTWYNIHSLQFSSSIFCSESKKNWLLSIFMMTKFGKNSLFNFLQFAWKNNRLNIEFIVARSRHNGFSALFFLFAMLYFAHSIVSISTMKISRRLPGITLNCQMLIASYAFEKSSVLGIFRIVSMLGCQRLLFPE